MTILVFYPVGNDLNWGREDFDCMGDEEALKVLWANRVELDARFYDMESHCGNRDTYGIGQSLCCDADDFERDYNDEELDGGWWVKALHVPSEYVKKIISGDYGEL